MRKLLVILLSLISLSLFGKSANEANKSEIKEVNVYTHRHYDSDKQLFKLFETKTGIKVNVVSAKADQLIERLKTEGKNSPADILITVDAGRLYKAKELDLLQPIESNSLDIVPAHLKDSESYWFGLTKRARVFAYDKSKVDPSEFSTYENLVNKKWNGRIVIRSSSNIYNQSLLASIIANSSRDEAKVWAESVVGNMAREPKGNDRDQMKAVAAGIGDIAVVNTYYLGKLLSSKDEAEVEVGNKIAVFFPNQDGRGTHINVSGIGVTKHSKNYDHAVKFIEFLLTVEAQEIFASSNYEYPVNPEANVSDLVKSWGEFKEDELSLSKLGEYNSEAVKVFDEAGWK